MKIEFQNQDPFSVDNALRQAPGEPSVIMIAEHWQVLKNQIYLEIPELRTEDQFNDNFRVV